MPINNCDEFIKIGHASSKGKGIFTTRKIDKGALVMTVCGEKLKYTPENIERYTEDRMWHINYGWVLIAESPAMYTNHSCDPNCGVKNLVDIVAMRDILKDEEITIDYDMIEYDWTMKCLCGNARCRGTIHGYKHLQEADKKRYSGFISDYLLVNPEHRKNI